jgi:Flp pilus assembly pilin Flp
MQKLCRWKQLLANDDANTAVEYAVMLALILGAVIIGVTTAGGGVGQWWTDIKNDITSY